MIAKAGGREKTSLLPKGVGKKTKYPLNCMFLNPVLCGAGEGRPEVILRRILVMSNCNFDIGGKKNLKRKFN